MTYEQLEKVNKEIKTTDVKGKGYAEVNQRIKAFRKLHPNGCIRTNIENLENGVCIIKATVSNEQGELLGTGYAYEKEGSTFINKTSYIENCETSAVGRALGMLGIGVDVSVASYEEVANAIEQQNAANNAPVIPKSEEDAKSKCTKEQVEQIESLIAERKEEPSKYLEKYNDKKTFADLSKSQAKALIDYLKRETK